MQKLEYVKKLEEITIRLKSDEIVNGIISGFISPTVPYDYSKVKPYLFGSKSQYDQMVLDPSLNNILQLFEVSDMYSDTELAYLPNIFTAGPPTHILQSHRAIRYFNFHNGLLMATKIAKNLLSNDIINNTNEQNLDSGIILFTVKIDSEGLDASKYIRIFDELNELFEVITKIYHLPEHKLEVISLDSGSDTNIAVKGEVEAAKVVFQTFKEIWDFITSYGYLRNTQKNNALIESLTVRKKVLEFVEDKTLSDIEAQEYIHVIKTRTDKLIGLKVLPRELIQQNHSTDSSKILDEYKAHVLEAKKEDLN